MSWLTSWLRQTVEWEPYAGDDYQTGPDWDDAQTISARKEAASRNIAGTGEIRQGNTIWVEEEVNVGDRIDGEIVQGRNSLTDMDGETVGYEIRTEP